MGLNLVLLVCELVVGWVSRLNWVSGLGWVG